MSNRRPLSVAALVLACFLTGCSIMPFEDPEEQRQAEERTATEAQDRAVTVDPASLLADDRTFEQTLTGDAGQVLASYTAHLPSFTVDTEKKGAGFERVNEYYGEQLAGYRQDCESFFDMVKGYYGDSWASVPVTETLFSTVQTYTLASAPEGYLCVLRAYTVRDNKGEDTIRDAEVFLIDSGWRLSLSELFGSHYEEAAPDLLDGIRKWCMSNGMTEEDASKLVLEDFSQGYGMDSSSLMFFLRPFTLSTSDEQPHIIRLPLSDYADLLPENIVTPRTDNAVGDDPTGTV